MNDRLNNGFLDICHECVTQIRSQPSSVDECTWRHTPASTNREAWEPFSSYARCGNVAELTFVTLKTKRSIIHEQHTGKLNWGYEQVNVMALKLHVFFEARSRIFGHLKMILFPNWVLPLLAISYELIYSTCPLVISSLHVWDVYNKMPVNTGGIGEEEKIPKFKFNY